MSQPGNFLFYHAGGIGDFITTLPAIRALRLHHPKGLFVVLGRPAIASLGVEDGLFNRVEDTQAGRWSFLFDVRCVPDHGALSLLSSFREACIWTVSNTMEKRLRESGIQRIRLQLPFPGKPVHIVDYHLAILTSGERAKAESIPQLDFPLKNTEQRLPSNRKEPGSVAIHPGSGSPKKNWGMGNFIGLAEWLLANHWRVTWITGEAEKEFPRTPPDRVTRLHQLPLSNLAEELVTCSLFVGNDSGITHLAAATGIPTLALFGNSDSAVWAPRGRRVRILEGGKGGVRGILPARVMDEAQKMLSYNSLM